MSIPVPLAEEFEIAVFKKGASVKGIAHERISREEAQHYVDCGAARWVNNRYKSIQMLIEAVPMKFRDISAQMGPHVIDMVLEDKFFAQVIVAGWRGPIRSSRKAA